MSGEISDVVTRCGHRDGGERDGKLCSQVATWFAGDPRCDEHAPEAVIKMQQEDALKRMRGDRSRYNDAHWKGRVIMVNGMSGYTDEELAAIKVVLDELYEEFRPSMLAVMENRRGKSIEATAISWGKSHGMKWTVFPIMLAMRESDPRCAVLRVRRAVMKEPVAVVSFLRPGAKPGWLVGHRMATTCGIPSRLFHVVDGSVRPADGEA